MKTPSKDTEEADSYVSDKDVQACTSQMRGMAPGDFEAMPSAKISTEAADGEKVKMIVMGTAKGGMLTKIYGADISSDEEAPEEKKSKNGRIKLVLMSGEDEEE